MLSARARLQPGLLSADARRITEQVETTRRLINSVKWPEGFARLFEMGRLDLTLEAGIYDNPKFQALFDEDTLAACKARLVEVDYIKADKS